MEGVLYYHFPMTIYNIIREEVEKAGNEGLAEAFTFRDVRYVVPNAESLKQRVVQQVLERLQAEQSA